jgi:hypothetical protein
VRNLASPYPWLATVLRSRRLKFMSTRELGSRANSGRIIKLVGALKRDPPLRSNRDGESLPGRPDRGASADNRRPNEWRARRDSNPRPTD